MFGKISAVLYQPGQKVLLKDSGVTYIVIKSYPYTWNGKQEYMLKPASLWGRLFGHGDIIWKDESELIPIPNRRVTRSQKKALLALLK